MIGHCLLWDWEHCCGGVGMGVNLCEGAGVYLHVAAVARKLPKAPFFYKKPMAHQVFAGLAQRRSWGMDRPQCGLRTEGYWPSPPEGQIRWLLKQVAKNTALSVITEEAIKKGGYMLNPLI